MERPSVCERPANAAGQRPPSSIIRKDADIRSPNRSRVRKRVSFYCPNTQHTHSDESRHRDVMHNALAQRASKRTALPTASTKSLALNSALPATPVGYSGMNPTAQVRRTPPHKTTPPSKKPFRHFLPMNPLLPSLNWTPDKFRPLARLSTVAPGHLPSLGHIHRITAGRTTLLVLRSHLFPCSLLSYFLPSRETPMLRCRPWRLTGSSFPT